MCVSYRAALKTVHDFRFSVRSQTPDARSCTMFPRFLCKAPDPHLADRSSALNFLCACVRAGVRVALVCVLEI